ncbi:MAG TPA: flagellar hook capping FlgD N-terminal domain-containing protein [Steroidobacteraceae bacterium]|jgi:flagellar basal-body rod modification protein FlgD|nr:flagellar hook capping FlgD N-terminal domain-containing protein [Steroidobacteraceae bacterium]
MTSPVNPTTGSGSSTSGTSGTGSGSGSGALGGLTMNDFLTLMTAQLQNQDPLNPTDSNEFLDQLSELSTVEGISQLNTSVSTLSTSMLSSQAISSAALVGQSVLSAAGSASYSAGGTLSGAVQVPSGTTGVTVTITNSSGAIVNQMAVSPAAGLQSFSWNGTAANGAAAPSGTYNVTATAEVAGTAEAATTLINGTVSSVTLDASGTGVTLNTPQLGAIPLSSVQQID